MSLGTRPKYLSLALLRFMGKVGGTLALLSRAYVYFISFGRRRHWGHARREEKQKFCWEITGARDWNFKLPIRDVTQKLALPPPRTFLLALRNAQVWWIEGGWGRLTAILQNLMTTAEFSLSLKRKACGQRGSWCQTLVYIRFRAEIFITVELRKRPLEYQDHKYELDT